MFRYYLVSFKYFFPFFVPDFFYRKIFNKMLSDEQRREIEYALEYAMLAALNPLPMPAPPQQNIVSSIPVPRNWKPVLELPQYMLETLPFLQLKTKISELQDLITHDLQACARNSYLVRAHSYLTIANCYLIRAHTEQFVASLAGQT
ncbi:hypothetical protein ABFX02_12G018500 [Erythranthe guttata]